MKAWEAFLSKLDEQLGKDTVDKWVRTLKVHHFDACNLYLEAKDSFQVLWFEEHVRPSFLHTFKNENDHKIKVHITCPGEVKKEAIKKEPEEDRFALSYDQLDPWATLENYIATKSNEVPFKLICELTGYDPRLKKKSPPKLGTYNPIYLFGPSGSGKTHLLMAAASSLKAENLNVIYVRGETFTQHVVSAIRSSRMQEFRATYRHADVLIIDDVQLFARRNATQEELFHTFNTLHTAGKQIILSGNAQPSALPAIEERLISRFEWGITLPLDKIGGKELNQLAKARSRSLKFPLTEESTAFLIETFGSNTKSLHKAIEALILRTHLESSSKMQSHGSLPLSAVKHCLNDLIEGEKRRKLTPEKIISSVAAHFSILPSDILGKSQSHECSLPRQIAMHICRYTLKLPYMKIGRLFERDHSTVMSSIKAIQKRIDLKDKEVTSPLPEILRLLEEPSTIP